MNRIPLVATLLAAAVATTGRAADAEKELTRLTAQFTDAMVKGDTSFLGGVMDDDWTLTRPTGEVVAKPQFLKELTDGTMKCDAMDKSEVKVRVYGDAAVVSGRILTKIKYKGQEVGGTDRFTEVYVRRGGKWQNVSTQATPLAAQREKP